jgi:hypothetical protein
MFSYWFFNRYFENTPKIPKKMNLVLNPNDMPKNRNYFTTPYSLFRPDLYKENKFHEIYKMSGTFK